MFVSAMPLMQCKRQARALGARRVFRTGWFNGQGSSERAETLLLQENEQSLLGAFASGL